MKLKLFLSTAALVACSLQSAKAQSLDNIFGKFSQCDASFFTAMKDGAQDVRTLAPTASSNDALWFKVPNRRDEETGMIAFTGNPTIAALPVTSYLDYVINLQDSGLYYTWGFKVRGEIATVVNALKPIIFESNRLRRDDSVYVRTELRDGTSAWLPVKTAGGTVPKSGTVERALLIEPDDKDKSLVTVTCNIQGSVEAAILKELRPDIEENDYPKKPEVVTFEGVNVAPELIAKLQLALKQQTLFMPKFTKAVVAYRKVSVKGGFAQTDTLIHTKGGLVDVLEDVGQFKFRRQNIGGVLQTKYGFINRKGDLFGGVRIAKSGSIEFSKDLVKNEVAFKSTVTSQQVPVLDKKELTFSQVCTVGETIAASNVFSKLPGSAILFNCILDGRIDDAIGYALIEDYGLVLAYQLPETKSEFKTIYTSVVVER
jgi:hypothetical protein